jgi:hypothetical protein
LDDTYLFLIQFVTEPVAPELSVAAATPCYLLINPANQSSTISIMYETKIHEHQQFIPSFAAADSVCSRAGSTEAFRDSTVAISD